MGVAVDPACQYKRELLGQLEKQRGAGTPSSSGVSLLRAEVPVGDWSVLGWLRAQPEGSRGYWSDRDSDFELAGTGRADALTGDVPADDEALMATLAARTQDCEHAIRYFGGLRFAPGRAMAPEWRAFGTYRFILPRCEVVSRGGQTVLACNMRREEELALVAEELDRTVFSPQPLAGDAARAVQRENAPEKAGWVSMVSSVLDDIADGTYQKLVLARRVTYAFDEPLSPTDLLVALKRVTRNRFHFCFQPAGEQAFVGASPERLYRREGRGVMTEAVAGTRPRGRSVDEDRAMSQALLTDEKERREHAFVVDGIREDLGPFCEALTTDPEPRILALDHGQHLVSRFNGRLKPAVRDGDLLRALHPTPAVGGYPQGGARGRIEALEPFDRGWYAGPVGWVSRDAAQFAVGIRAALVDHRRLHVYSGAGVVDGSDAGREWDEVENKIRDFVGLVTPK